VSEELLNTEELNNVTETNDAVEINNAVELNKTEQLLNKLVETIQSKAGEDAIEDSKLNFNRPMIVIDASAWQHELAAMLRDNEQLQFDLLSCISGVDYDDHMEVVYQFYSYTLDNYLMLKVKTNRQSPSVISVKQFWNTADWHEREAYDLLGINFEGHPNLTRILLQDEWVGHPLRKDYVVDKEGLGLD
jgi:NADH-quinone oxidoreductase subunit C